MTATQTYDDPECLDCGNDAPDWFVRNDRLESNRCTKCGSYNTRPE